MNYSEKIKLIRVAEELSQVDFYGLTGIPISTARKFENGFSEVGLTSMEKITTHPRFKKYTLWLMTDEVAPEAGQISPEIEEERRSANS